MTAKIYVGNLPFSTTEKDLQEMYGEYGEVTEVVIIKDKFSGRSKGFGFVTFAEEDAAQQAISQTNGKDVGGRQIKVNESRPMDPNNRPVRKPFTRGPNQGRNKNRDYEY